VGISFSKGIKGKFWLGILYAFIVANVADALTSIPALGAETNPTYVLTGSIWIMLIAKIIAIVAMYIGYRVCFGNNLFVSYLFTFIGVWLTFILVVFGAVGNIAVWSQPQLLERAIASSPEQKMDAYNSFMMWWYLVPFAVMILNYPVMVSGFKRSQEKTERNV
jgi:hypothetical protein